MALDEKKIKEAIERPSKKIEINKAVLLEKRLRFHTDTNISERHVIEPTTEFLNWVKLLLPKDKYNTFLQLFRFPVPTVSLVKRSYRELERIFEAKDAAFVYRFDASETLADWEQFRLHKMHEPEVWKKIGWKMVKLHPNSILVIDLPDTQASALPEPYFYWLDISHVVDYKLKTNTEFEWLIFRQPENRIAVFDDASIRIYELDEDHVKIKRKISESTHGLGYCPARFFLSESISAENRCIKKNPITEELSNLDWYLFFAISKRHLDLYAPYPIYSAYEADCNFENNETGDYCDGGFLRNINGDYKILADGTLEKCPVCGEKRIAGPGSFLEIPVPNQADGVADMRNPIQITSIDKNSLDYNVKEIERLGDEIVANITGTHTQAGAAAEKEAVNELQVEANFESRKSVLLALKSELESAQRFVDDTIAKIRYGEKFISSSINWGTEFYLYTQKELREKYNTAKKDGAPMYELSALQDKIIDLEYKNNPLELQRAFILKQLEPLQQLSFNEITTLFRENAITLDEMLLKMNFMEYVERFERENINILDFASKKPLADKISIIKTKLTDYAKEDARRAASNEPKTAQNIEN